MTINKTRNLLYKIARALGDVNAVSRGPKAIVKRLTNKLIGRKLISKAW
jgi:hypothetical protein